jgi:benzylsuccinate CoA-transferase BbsF subunit
MIELQAKGIPAAAVHHPRSQFEDPQLGHREFFQPLDQLALGDLFLEGACFKSDTMPLQAAKSAPLLGQHTREICSSLLGLPDAEVERLFEEGVLEETLLE